MSKSLSLNGVWKLACFDHEKGEEEKPYVPDFCDSNWLDAHVPGDVHLDLMRVGKIPDPFFGKKAETCRWIEDKDWWYRKSFCVPEDFVQDVVKLIFKGLDTYATIWLNGELIGRHSNMWTPCELDVTGKIKLGENLLAVKLASAIKILETKDVSNFAEFTYYGPRVYARKAQFTFGWDFAPRLVSVGIWRSVELRSYRKVGIKDVFVKTDITGKNRADVQIEVTLINYTPQSQEAEIAFTISKDGELISKSVQKEVSPGSTTVSTLLQLSNAEFWWPNGAGKPTLYQLKTEVKVNDEVLDQSLTRFGVREVELLQELDAKTGTKSFTICVNGKKIFCKGANWVPADLIIARVDEQKYEKLLIKAKDANFNMLRVWGGGTYEESTFYDLCDELGIMIWQDFMFACAGYPEEQNFLEEVEKEAVAVIRQLRNHPSIVIWCGNNENDWLHWVWLKEKSNRKFYGKQIYHKILPTVCRKLDGTRPYWPSSPYGGENPNSQTEGDRHSYQVFLGVVDPIGINTSFDHIRYENYSKDEGKFISEFAAIPGVLDLKTLKKFLSPEDLDTNSDVWRYHVVSLGGWTQHLQDILDIFFREYLGEIPKNINKYVKIAQLVQCEVLKYGIEHFRRRKFDCSGTLFWMFADVWPAISWGVVDYYTCEKASYYYVKRAYNPVLISFKEEELGVSVWVTNDNLKPIEGRVELRCQTFSGKTLWEDTIKINVPSNSSIKIKEIRFNEIRSEDARKEFLSARIYRGDRVLSQNQFFRRLFKDLILPVAKLGASVKKVVSEKSFDSTFLVKVATDRYARVVRLKILGAPAVYSDNFFDMFPKEEKLVTVRLPSKKKEKVRIEIDCINGEKPLSLLLT